MAAVRLCALSRRMILSPFLQLRAMSVGEKGGGAGKVSTQLVFL